MVTDARRLPEIQISQSCQRQVRMERPCLRSNAGGRGDGFDSMLQIAEPIQTTFDPRPKNARTIQIRKAANPNGSKLERRNFRTERREFL